MKYVIVYWSRYGHNKKIVDTISKKLNEKGEAKVFSTKELEPTNLPEADTYIFSGSAEAFRLEKNMRKFLKKLEGLEKKNYAIINTHGMKRNWLNSMDKILSKKNMKKVAEIDFQIGSEGQKTGDGFIGDWEDKLNNFIGKI